MKKKSYTLLLASGVLAPWVLLAQGLPVPNPEISQDQRIVEAQNVLNEVEKAITVYVKGLCCPSCATGIRIKVSVLDFVDTARLTKGVTLDTKTQLATIAVKDEADVDPAALAQAIRDAGYTPFHLYRLRDGKLETTVIPGD